jgi:predicted esterase
MEGKTFTEKLDNYDSVKTASEFRTQLTRDTPGVFPDPKIIEPLLEHKETFIILHGRGSFADKFGPPLLAMPSSSNETLQEAFPHAKIIFPTASRNRATIYNRSLPHQWFDNWHLEEHTKRQDLMAPELKKSIEYIRGLLEREIAEVGRDNTVLWGLSQGCATSLACLMTWSGEPFAAVVGMCGWLPYGNVMLDICNCEANTFDDPFSQDDSDEDDPFARSDDESDGQGEGIVVPKTDSASKAVAYLREEVELQDTAGDAFKRTPVFLGHGTSDNKVAIELGREAESVLERVGADVEMVEYEALDHWYSPEMLRDIFHFLKDKLP